MIPRAAELRVNPCRLTAMPIVRLRAAIVAASLIAAAVVAACGPSAAPSLIRSAVPVSLAGTAWTAVLVAGQPTVSGSEPTAAFTADQVQGPTGCNDYRASYRYAAGAIALDEPISTAIGCDGAVAATERRFMAALRSASSVSIDDQGRLVIAGTGGPITFVVAPVGQPVSTPS
jgi:heat shock protein HslJ